MQKTLLTLALAVSNVCWGSVLWEDDFTDAQLQVGGGSNSLNRGDHLRVLAIENPFGLPPIETKSEIGGGAWDITNGIGDNATYRLWYDWLGANTPIPVGATNIEVWVAVIGSDGNESQIKLGGIGSGATIIPENSLDLLYAFPGMPGGKLTFEVTGEDGFDLAIDRVYITGDLSEVPEPTTYAMVGAGLLVLAFRRRG